MVPLAIGLGLAVVIGMAPTARAHPLGNATVNHYDGLELQPDHISDTAVVDVAEIPTLQRKPLIDSDNDGVVTSAEQSVYAARQCADLAAAVRITVDGRVLHLQVDGTEYAERPGAIGLPAGRLVCRLSAAADLTRPVTVGVEDEWDSAGIGWHEVTAVGSGVTLHNSPVPARSVSDALQRYPDDLLSSPLDTRGAQIEVLPGPGASTYAGVQAPPSAGPVARLLGGLTTWFDGLVGTRDLTVEVGFLAVLLAVLLGAGHAFLPGHGKTVMAAYLVGKQGRYRDVATVGATVTLTHTAGVMVIGLALSLTASLAPTAVEQYLAVASGLLVAGVGAGLLLTAMRRRRTTSAVTSLDLVAGSARAGGAPSPSQPVLAATPAGASSAPGDRAAAFRDPLLGTPAPQRHQHGHEHPHEDHGHEHPHDLHAQQHGHHGQRGHGDAPVHTHGGVWHRHGEQAAARQPAAAGAGRGDQRFGRAGLVGLGVAGGLVPSPSALLVLLAAVALGRTAFGIVLVLGYGVGMAGALTAAGLLLVRLRGPLGRLANHPRLPALGRLAAALPALTAFLVLLVGIGLVLQALAGSF